MRRTGPRDRADALRVAAGYQRLTDHAFCIESKNQVGNAGPDNPGATSRRHDLGRSQWMFSPQSLETAEAPCYGIDLQK
jgi:hypothetical protein